MTCTTTTSTTLDHWRPPPRELTGVLFPRDRRKHRNSTSPDYTGRVVVGGVVYEAALWTKTDAAGGHFYGLGLRPHLSQREIDAILAAKATAVSSSSAARRIHGEGGAR